MPLTPELVDEVRRLYQEGKSTREIAKALRLSLRDVGVALGPSISNQMNELAEMVAELERKVDYLIKNQRRLMFSLFGTAFGKKEEIVCPFCGDWIIPELSSDEEKFVCPKCRKTLAPAGI
jgi:transposase-like protein